MWLNFALQPCAVALDGKDDHDCPHCPHGNDGSSAELPALAGMPCATSANDCGQAGELWFDGRDAGLKLKDAPSKVLLAILPVAPPVPAVRSVARERWHPARSPPPGNRTPLNVLYCVYLD